MPKSSTTLALVSMIHRWLSQTDGNGATIRIILFDYRKAFDLIDHEILASKLCSLDLPVSVVNWIIDSISVRYQGIKLADDCFSEWCKVPSGLPQRTIMVNGKELEIVPKAKLLGLTISSNLTWNAHVRDVIKKASKRIYFLIQLKRANVSYDNLKLFYTTCIRSILDYAVPVFHYSTKIFDE